MTALTSREEYLSVKATVVTVITAISASNAKHLDVLRLEFGGSIFAVEAPPNLYHEGEKVEVVVTGVYDGKPISVSLA